VAVVETQRGLERPAMVFYPGAELNSDPTNWWGPNRQCMEALLKLVGFGRIVYQPHLIDKGVRGIFLAYKKHGRAPSGIHGRIPYTGIVITCSTAAPPRG